MVQVPPWEKINLTIKEAAALFGIGEKKIIELTEDESCPYVLYNGNKRLIKRKKFEKYLESAFSI